MAESILRDCQSGVIVKNVKFFYRQAEGDGLPTMKAVAAGLAVNERRVDFEKMIHSTFET